MATNANAIKIFDLSTWSCRILTGHTDIVMTLDSCVIDDVDHLVSGSKVSWRDHLFIEAGLDRDDEKH